MDCCSKLCAEPRYTVLDNTALCSEFCDMYASIRTQLVTNHALAACHIAILLYSLNTEHAYNILM
jgi:hypothetical protein